jgi:hypothetical protein
VGIKCCEAYPKSYMGEWISLVNDNVNSTVYEALNCRMITKRLTKKRDHGQIRVTITEFSWRDRRTISTRELLNTKIFYSFNLDFR